jgi:hypothetical protein
MSMSFAHLLTFLRRATAVSIMLAFCSDCLGRDIARKSPSIYLEEPRYGSLFWQDGGLFSGGNRCAACGDTAASHHAA